MDDPMTMLEELLDERARAGRAEADAESYREAWLDARGRLIVARRRHVRRRDRLIRELTLARKERDTLAEMLDKCREACEPHLIRELTLARKDRDTLAEMLDECREACEPHLPLGHCLVEAPAMVRSALHAIGHERDEARADASRAALRRGDYDGHPAIRSLRARQRPTPEEGELVCPDCDGLGTVISQGNTGLDCTRCVGSGLVRVCQHCATPLDWLSYRKCQCSGAQADLRSARHAADVARWREHAASPWSVPSPGPVWSEGLDAFVEDHGELQDAWREHIGWPAGGLPQIVPEWALLYACEPVHLRPDASDQITAWSEALGCEPDWEPLADLGDEARDELQAALDAWVTKWASDLGWEPNYSRPVLPPEGE